MCVSFIYSAANCIGLRAKIDSFAHMAISVRPNYSEVVETVLNGKISIAIPTLMATACTKTISLVRADG